MNNGKFVFAKSWDLLVERVENKLVYINSQGYLHSCVKENAENYNIKYNSRERVESDTYTFQDGTTMSVEEIMVRRFREEEAKQVDGKLTIIHLDGNKHNRNLGNLKVLEFDNLPTLPHREVVLVDLKRGCNAVFKNKYYMAHELGLNIEVIDKTLYKGSESINKIVEYFVLRDYSHLWFMLKSQYHEYKKLGLLNKMINIYESNKNFYKMSDPEWYRKYIKKVMKNES